MLDTREVRDAINLARLFSQKLEDVVPIRDVIDRNKAEDEPSVCHSHDFVDANMVMAAAFEEAFGQQPDVDSVDDANMCSAAWDIAKAADFFI